MARKEYVYALKITWPEGSRDENGFPVSGWYPTHYGWGERMTDADFVDAQRFVDAYGYFRWPVNRKYRSLHAAGGKAHKFERYGCQVEIIRSLPIEWPEEPSVVREPNHADYIARHLPRAVASAARIHVETAE